MRPTSAVVFGVVDAAVASTATAVYVAVTETDDGLETLLFLPALAVCSAVAAFGAGWRGRTAEWPLVAALTATVFTLVLLASLGVGADGATVTPALVGATVVVGMFAVAGGMAGWGAGHLAHRLHRGGT